MPGCYRRSTTVDHIVPLSRGGSRLHRGNLQGMCGHHNFAKGNRMTRPPKPATTAPTGERYCGCGAQIEADRKRCDACDFFDRPVRVGTACVCGDPECPGRWHIA